MKTNKVIIQWIGTDKEGNPQIQYRKYNDTEKAADFISGKLANRNIKQCIKKEYISFEDEDRVTPGQMAMDI